MESHGRIVVGTEIPWRGIIFCSMCSLCRGNEEFIQHIFFECTTTVYLSSWWKGIFIEFSYMSIDSILSLITSPMSLFVEKY